MDSVQPYTEAEMAFLRQVPDLPDDLSLSTAQTSIVIGESVEWLRKKRQGSDGAGPPFEQHGDETSIRYPLGGVRRWKRERTFSNTREAREARKHMRLAAFVMEGRLDDTEYFRDAPDGRPVICDKGDSDAYPLELGDFLDRCRAAARDRSLAANAQQIGEGTAEGVPVPGGRPKGVL